MAQDFTSKTDEILSKLGKLDVIATEIQALRQSVEKINSTVANLIQDFSRVERDLKKDITGTCELEANVKHLNKDVEEGRAKLEESKAKSEEELNKLRQQLLDFVMKCTSVEKIYVSLGSERREMRTPRKPCITSWRKN